MKSEIVSEVPKKKKEAVKKEGPEKKKEDPKAMGLCQAVIGQCAH